MEPPTATSGSRASLDEDVLIEYVQGNLSPAARASLEQRLAEDSDARQVVAALAGLSIFSSTAPAAPRPEGEQAEPDAESPAAEEVLADKYRVIAQLGRGAMGVVLEVEHLLLRERYALKLMRRGTASDKHAVHRLVREARAAMRIDSPHVARVFDLGVLPDGRLFLVMELLAGRDLRSILAETPKLPISTAISYIRQAALGVGAAHAAGVVHRDLKPANLFVTRTEEGDEHLEVVDFGLSKAPDVHRRASDEAALTTSGSVIGSPMYMAPEQIRDPKSADARSDLWALGVVLYEMVTGRPPFAAQTVAGVLAAIMVDPPRRIDQPIPASLERTLLDCLAKDPEARIASADQLLARLERWEDEVAETPRGRPQGRARAWAVGAAVVALGGTALASLGMGTRPETATARSFDLAAPALAPPPTSSAAEPVASASAAASVTARPRAPRPAAPGEPKPEVVFGKETDQRR